MDGKRQGRWVHRKADGRVVEERHYVDGKMHGGWVIRGVDGTESDASYMNGEKVSFVRRK